MEQSRIDRINALTAQLENTWVGDEHGNRRRLTRREE